MHLGMSKIWKKLCGSAFLMGMAAFVVALLASTVFAGDIIAQASNGATVILHDNGRWEYYQNNKNIRDVRPSAIPEDAKFEVTIAYESVDQLKKNIRMAMDADFATEEEIKDSLRKVPKGGIVYFQVPTKQIKPGMVRELTYSIYDKGKTPVFTQKARDTEATPSEDRGVSNLMVAPLYARPKSKVLKATVVSESTRSTLEFEIPVP